MIYIVSRNKWTKKYEVQTVDSTGCTIPSVLFNNNLNDVYVVTEETKYNKLITQFEKELKQWNEKG
jgi:hypothetical protein